MKMESVASNNFELKLALKSRKIRNFCFFKRRQLSLVFQISISDGEKTYTSWGERNEKGKGWRVKAGEDEGKGEDKAAQ